MTDQPVYVPKIGDTVRWPDSPEGWTYTVKDGPSPTGAWLVESSHGRRWDVIDDMSGALEVLPTPADRYLACNEHGCPISNLSYASSSTARSAAVRDVRVARFTFAGWVGDKP